MHSPPRHVQLYGVQCFFSHLSLLNNVVGVTTGESGTLQKVHDIILTAMITNTIGRVIALIRREIIPCDTRTVSPDDTYVTIFLSKKYWSFFAPMTRRSETSSLSIWNENNWLEIRRRISGQCRICWTCIVRLQNDSFLSVNRGRETTSSQQWPRLSWECRLSPTMNNHDGLIFTKRIITCLILTGSRLSELSNMISTNAEITRGPVPSCLDRGQVTQLTHNIIVIVCVTLLFMWIYERSSMLI